MSRDVSSRELAVRLWESMLATDRPDEALVALAEFLPEATFHVRDDVKSARIVRCGSQYRVEFGRVFLEQELAAPADLAFVFLHEVYHHVLGHLAQLPPAYQTPDWRQVVNLAADMMVNRAVTCRYFTGGAPLLTRLYWPDGFPECLLLPPTSYGCRRVSVAEATSLEGRRELRDLAVSFKKGIRQAGWGSTTQDMAWQVYRAAWLEEVPFDRLLGMVARLLQQVLGEGGFFYLFFLGDHEPDAARCEGLPWQHPDKDGDPAGGAGFHDEVEESDLDEDIEPRLSPVLAQAVRLALEEDPNHPRRRFGQVPQPGVLFAPDRSDWLTLTLGQWPALFHGGCFGIVEDEQRAHLYIDVSGSVDPWIGRFYGLVLALGDEIGSPVHLFSNQVLDMTLDDLARGRVRTTGGTDFDCVVTHALERGYRRIVVVTDGIGDLDSANAEAFRASGASLYLLLMGMGIDVADTVTPLFALARQTWELK